MATDKVEPMSLAEWNDGYTTTIIKMLIMTVVFIVCLVLLFTLGNIQEIAKNFPRYRCNPIIMPFASNFGYDTQENFNYCLTSIFNMKAAEIFTPIYAILGTFTDIITQIMNVALGLRKLFSNFLLGINNFMRNVKDRIQGLLFNVRMSFLKINNLMGRVYGTMYAVIWMGTSALTAGMNVSENDLVKFLLEFCFAPNTPVKLNDGSYVPISELKIGDRLASVNGQVPRVTSVFRFKGDNTPMVRIADVHVSAAHYVFKNGGWLMAAQHPDAIGAESIPELVCLNVSTHEFRIGEKNLLVADYDEHETAEVVQKTQEYAMKHLNNRTSPKDSVEDYSLGMDGSVKIRMDDNTWKSLNEIKIGESVWNSGEVLGIVSEKCEDVVDIHGFAFSAAQTVFDGLNWVRALHYSTTERESAILYNLITQRCGTIQVRCGDIQLFVRDYREIADPAMEDEYTEAFGVATAKR